jgi:hypothetical protein
MKKKKKEQTPNLTLWAAVHSHQYGVDSYLFLVDLNADFDEVDETLLPDLLGMEYDEGEDLVFGPLVNPPVDPTALRDRNGNPLPIYSEK